MKIQFIEKLLKRFIRKPPTKVAGVEVANTEDGSLSFHSVVLERKKNEVLLVSQLLDVSNPEVLAKALGPDIGVNLAINVKGVLHKRLPAQTPEASLRQAALPNAKPDDFYWQTERLSEGYAVSIARKDLIDSIIGTFRQNGLWVTDLSFGPFNIRHIYSFLPKPATVSANDLVLMFDEKGYLSSFERMAEAQQAAVESTILGSDSLNNRLLTSYATAFKGLFVGGGSVDVPTMEHNREEFFHFQLFKKNGLKILASILAVLVLNAFFYYHFKDKLEVAKTTLSVKRTELATLDSLEKSQKEQEAFFKQTQLNKATKASFYADRIAASLPQGIKLLDLEIFPLKGKKTDYEQGTMLQYIPNTVLVKGRCENSLLYNKWLKDLESQAWVSSVEHLTYKETGFAQKDFELRIVIGEPSK